MPASRQLLPKKVRQEITDKLNCGDVAEINSWLRSYMGNNDKTVNARVILDRYCGDCTLPYKNLMSAQGNCFRAKENRPQN